MLENLAIRLLYVIMNIMYVLYVTTLLTTQFYDKFGALASKIIKKPEILLRYFLLICCCVKLHIHASWFFLSWYRTPHSFDYCVSCLLPYRHDGMGRKKVSVVLEIESYNKRSCGGMASQTSDGFFPLGEYLQSKG